MRWTVLVAAALALAACENMRREPAACVCEAEVCQARCLEPELDGTICERADGTLCVAASYLCDPSAAAIPCPGDGRAVCADSRDLARAGVEACD